MSTSNPVTFAICGCGCRGMEAYAPYQKRRPDQMKIVAGADPRPERLALLRELYDVPPEACFSTDTELLAQPRLADVMIIATQDRQHIGEALAALDKGYHLLLEKPISTNLEDCLALLRKAHETKRVVVLGYVLRYTKFYAALHTMLRRGEIGKLEAINAVEHVGYWHFAHSYVRGNWRRTDETSPVILAKCSHDMDILRWLAGGRCLRVQSFGGLDHFRAECAPEGAAHRCLDGCLCKEQCPYDAEKIYLTNEQTGYRAVGKNWPCSVLTDDPTPESLREAIRTGPYGRCVYHCDNDAADHQTVNMLFENNVTASFTMSAFTQRIHRTIKVMGSLGEIEGDMEQNRLTVRRFGEPERVIELDVAENEFAGHGGGDAGLMEALCGLIAAGGSEGLTNVDASVESHVMAFAAEASRAAGGICIDLEEFTARRE